MPSNDADSASQRLRKAPRREGPVRFAVVGQGHFAQSAILPAFDEAPDCELVALFSDDRTKLDVLKAKYDVAHALDYDQYDEFLRSRAVDAVYIALPNAQHCDFTVRAAAAGVHVLCEKPMAVSSEECERMIAACAEAQVKLMVAYRLHFDEGNLAAVELVRGGKLGQPRFFTSAFSQQVTEKNTRTQARQGDGPLFDVGVYCINAIRYLFRAEPTHVTALAVRRPDDERFREIDEQVTATLLFADGRVATFVCSFGAVTTGWFEVVGTAGRLRVDPAYTNLEPVRYELTVGGKTKTKKFRRRDQVAGELQYFASCVLGDQQPEPSGEEGLADLRIIEAIEEAVRTGAKVAVDAVPRDARPSPDQVQKRPAHGEAPLVGVQPPSRG
jgi:glucose-fructose oxidoreductase